MLAAARILSAGPAAAQTALKFSLDGRWRALRAVPGPQDKGYFRNQGIDVTIDEAATPIEPITRVASAAYDMGFADINALISYRDQNPTAPVKAVFMVYNRPPFSDRGPQEPWHHRAQKLEGKKLGGPPAGSTFAAVAAVRQAQRYRCLESLARAHRPTGARSDARGRPARRGARLFLPGLFDLKDRGVPVDDIVLLQMANYGLKLYGSADRLNSNSPRISRKRSRVPARLPKGLKETIRSPCRGGRVRPQARRCAKKEVELERLRMAIRDNIVTPEVRANGFGAVDRERLEESINQIGITFAYKAKPKADDIFDASFLPPAAERRVN